MIIMVTVPDSSDIKDFNAIFICSNKSTKCIIDLIEDIDLLGLIHDDGEVGIELTDPFNFKRMFFN
jgi:hypothetical protein